MTTADLVTITASICALLITLLLVVATILCDDLKTRLCRLFLIVLILGFIGAGCEITTVFLQGRPGELIAVVIKTADFANYAGGNLQFIFTALYGYEYLSLKEAVNKRPYQLAIAINFVMLLYIAFTQAAGLLERLDEFNYVYPTNFSLVVQIILVLSLVIVIKAMLPHMNQMPAKAWIALLMFLIIPIACYAIEYVFRGVWVSYLGSAVATFIIYINIQMELKQRAREQELELLESRVALMLSQIKPHFMYNTLTAIEYLCNRDGAKQAGKAVHDFSKYLRGNLNSIAYKQQIPFENELEHTEHYLSIEQMQYEERLQVKLDIQAVDFTLPALTLQPIVENAVKHGISKREQGGVITIQSKADSTHWRVLVTDNGVGFDVMQQNEDRHAHFGLQNVRYRLERMCGGSLSIDSKSGAGTRVLISIPKKRRGGANK